MLHFGTALNRAKRKALLTCAALAMVGGTTLSPMIATNAHAQRPLPILICWYGPDGAVLYCEILA
jgi:hypothetical protein